MAFPAANSKAFNNLVCAALLAASVAAVLAAGFQFEVGGVKGWRIPTGDEPETYNEWAAKNRFRIGDTLQFKYQKDSVLMVNATDYLNCNASNPISKYENGDTVFQFDRSGLFYFISGQPGHCKLGQRLIVRVMHPSEIAGTPELAPSPAPGGDNSSNSGYELSPGVSSGPKVSVVSYSMTLFAGLYVILYLFM